MEEVTKPYVFSFLSYFFLHELLIWLVYDSYKVCLHDYFRTGILKTLLIKKVVASFSKIRLQWFFIHLCKMILKSTNYYKVIFFLRYNYLINDTLMFKTFLPSIYKQETYWRSCFKQLFFSERSIFLQLTILIKVCILWKRWSNSEMT